MSRPVPNPGILDIAPYTPGKTPVPEPGRKVFKLSANETPFGPSPKARQVYTQAAAHLEDYPEGTSRVLREAIGRAYRLDPNRIICGAGSDEILNLLAHTYLSHGDEAISTTHGFLVYPIATMANGARNVVAPETDFTADVDAILARVTPKTKLVWLANPNNPTGTYVPFDEVKRLRAGLPAHVLLVLDAAYSDYVSRNDYELGIELVATTENTVMTHTFSKIHGLAALRVGWMFGPAHIVDAVNRGESPHLDEPALVEGVPKVVAAGNLRATTSTVDAVKSAEVVVVIVPVLVDAARQIDFGQIDAATREIARGLQPGTLVLYETTLPVGTTRDRLGAMLAEGSGLVLDDGFYLGFSPERVLVGRVFLDLRRYPKIVGGTSEESGRRALAFYQAVLDEGTDVRAVANAETAEMTKLAETTYRDVNIALANEYARYADRHGIDVLEVIEAANSQPYSHIHLPGVGVGGHCIPVYPHFLFNTDPDLRLPPMARAINPGWLVC